MTYHHHDWSAIRRKRSNTGSAETSRQAIEESARGSAKELVHSSAPRTVMFMVGHS